MTDPSPQELADTADAVRAAADRPPMDISVVAVDRMLRGAQTLLVEARKNPSDYPDTTVTYIQGVGEALTWVTTGILTPTLLAVLSSAPEKP